MRFGTPGARLSVPAALLVGALSAALLAGCADREPEAPPIAPLTRTGTPTAAGSTAPTGTATTTALPGMPVPVSVGGSPVDAARLRSVDDLPVVFQCPNVPTPIRIPAPTPTTGVTAAPPPEAVVCASALAGKEAIYLWYTPTPETKLAALTYALDRTRYVHGGPNWVAAGTVNPSMGQVGGEVYR